MARPSWDEYFMAIATHVAGCVREALGIASGANHELCAKILLNAGVTDIVFREPYPDPLSAELLAEAGLVPRCIGGDA